MVFADQDDLRREARCSSRGGTDNIHSRGAHKSEMLIDGGFFVVGRVVVFAHIMRGGVNYLDEPVYVEW